MHSHISSVIYAFITQKEMYLVSHVLNCINWKRGLTLCRRAECRWDAEPCSSTSPPAAGPAARSPAWRFPSHSQSSASPKSSLLNLATQAAGPGSESSPSPTAFGAGPAARSAPTVPLDESPASHKSLHMSSSFVPAASEHLRRCN